VTVTARSDALVVDDLRVGFVAKGSTRHVVTGVSFAVKAGETLGLVGESGSGKTVTALACMGLLGPRDHATVSGSVRLGDCEIVGRSRRRLRRLLGAEISMIFQDPLASLDPAFTVGDQLVETIRAHTDLSRKRATERAIELLGHVGIPFPRLRFSSYPHELSGGMCQRVMIAIAVSCHPKVVIADEPTTALDVTVQARVLDLLRSLQDEFGMALLLISHDLAVVADCAERVAVMYRGEVVEMGDVEPVYHSPQHPYTEALLAATPHLYRRRGDDAALRDVGGVRAEPGAGCRFADRCRYAIGLCHDEAVELRLGDGHLVRCLRADELMLGGVTAHRSQLPVP
jgi:oligopeptide/dipeptide ABC transporter ATP-binding protein